MKILSLAISLVMGTAAFAEDCALDRVDLRGDFGTARFTVEIADDDAERSQGLMNRDYLGASQGMLFVYDSPTAPAFWMKNTLIPLDMVFVGPDGTVKHVHENAIPGDLTPIPGGSNILAVLEIRGGLAGAIGITPGSEMRHFVFEPGDTVWPCDAP